MIQRHLGMLIFCANAVYLLRAEQVGIILIDRDNTPVKASRVTIERERSKKLRCPSDQMEEKMITRLAAITLAVLFAAVSLIGYANAGASASAPSKNSRSSQLAAQQNGNKTATNQFGITEYSSSSARAHSARCTTTSSYC